MFFRIGAGNGLNTSTGAHGTTRYEAEYPGEYRFGLIGTTTPLSRSAGVALGNAGSRFVFHPMLKENDLNTLLEELNSGNYTKKQASVKYAITQWWRTFWPKYDGEITEEDWPSITEKEDMSIILWPDRRPRAVPWTTAAGKAPLTLTTPNKSRASTGCPSGWRSPGL